MAQTIADLLVEIGVDVSGLEKGSKEAKKTAKDMGSTVSDMAKTMGQNVQGFSDKWKLMSDEMKTSYKDAKAVLTPFKKDLMEVEYGFFKMAQGMNDYRGSTKEFISDVEDMGKKHKKVTDEMMKKNDFMKQGFIEGIGTMLARSTQSEKIAQNFDRMNNPLYKVNKGLLNVSKGLEGIAKKGMPAYLALKQLGPNANMKDLQDHTRMINQGLLRSGSVALVAAAGVAIFYGALHDAAMEMPGYAESFEGMISTLKEAFKPMVEVFADVMTPLYDFITKIGELMIKFNEAHPLLAKIGQGFLMLLPILFLLLAPLAVGIGLFGGLAAAWSALAPFIMPLITGFLSIAGTILIVAGVIVGLVTVFYLLWTKTTWFKDAVIGIWNALVDGTKQAWDWLFNNILKPVWDEIVAFGKKIFGKFKDFWDENGSQIIDIVMNWVNSVKSDIKAGLEFIKGIFQIVFPIIKGIVKVAWDFIKLIIETGIDIILGLIDAGMSLLEGDWEGAWDAIKGIAEDIWHNIESFFENIDLVEIGKDIIDGLIRGIGSMAGAITRKVKSLASLVPDGLKSFLGIHSPSRLIRDQVGKFIPLGMAEGMDDNLGSVEKSTEAMSRASVPNLSNITNDLINRISMVPTSNLKNAEVKSKGDTSITINARTVDLDEKSLMRTFQRMEVLYG